MIRGESVDPLKEVDERYNFIEFNYLIPSGWAASTSDGFFTELTSSGRYGSNAAAYSYDERGFVIVYRYAQGGFWKNTIAADGVYPAGQHTRTPFGEDPLSWGERVVSSLREVGFAAPLIDSHGAYVLSSQSASILRIVDQKIDLAGMVRLDQRAPRLILRSRNQLMEYILLADSGTEDWFADVQSEEEAYRIRTAPRLIVDREARADV